MTVIDPNLALADPAGDNSLEEASEILRVAIRILFRSRIALVSSFGAESAILLHMVSTIDRAVPVLFLDTGLHFLQTLAYRDDLVRRLGLTDVRSVAPEQAAVAAADPDQELNARAPDLCCTLRKVAPLAAALEGFDAWITGRKRFQGGARQQLAYLEPDGRLIKVNPIAAWQPRHVRAYLARHELPRHPLVSQGFSSIGCSPCTSRTAPGEEPRAGRWRGLAKTECGIHGRAKEAIAALNQSLDPGI